MDSESAGAKCLSPARRSVDRLRTVVATSVVVSVVGLRCLRSSVSTVVSTGVVSSTASPRSMRADAVVSVGVSCSAGVL